MENVSIESYVGTLYGLHSKTSKDLDERDAQNLVNDILISMLLSELSAERRQKVLQSCSQLLPALTGRYKMLGLYHEPMRDRIDCITKMSYAFMKDHEPNESEI